MLQITIPASVDLWDELNQEFVSMKEQTLQLEHSLVSLSKWESKWHKPFFSKTEKTLEETLDYIRCMTITPNIDSTVYLRLTPENIAQINGYIEDPMTAETFVSDNKKTPSREIITSEVIYYWMIANNIPFECQKWHINRLIALIRVCGERNAPPKKMSKKEIMSRNAALNAQRRAKLNSKG